MAGSGPAMMPRVILPVRRGRLLLRADRGHTFACAAFGRIALHLRLHRCVGEADRRRNHLTGLTGDCAAAAAAVRRCALYQAQRGSWAWRSGGTLVALRPGVAFVALRPRRTCWPSRPRHAHRPCRPDVAFWPRRTSRSGRPGRSSLPRRPGRASGPLRAGDARVAFRTGLPGRTFRPLRAAGQKNSCGDESRCRQDLHGSSLPWYRPDVRAGLW